MFNITKEHTELNEKFLMAVHRLYGWEYIADEDILAERRKTYGWIIDKCVLAPLSTHTKLSILDRLENLPFPPPINSIGDLLFVQAQMIAVITLMNISEDVGEFKILYNKMNPGSLSN
ncbi:MAG: hypothetical protein K0R82_1856 [Flavipsychrobacter sp.]|nr:hypothetical protein [Flavipsychrobacter sp.]